MRIGNRHEARNQRAHGADRRLFHLVFADRLWRGGKGDDDGWIINATEALGSTLKLAHLPNKPPPRLRLGGFIPPNDMPAGEYNIICEGASPKQSWKNGWRINLKYRVTDGEYTGVALNQWITVDASGVVSPRSRYVKQCEVALGRPLEPEDDLDNPASIFCGRFFRGFVGFRYTDGPRGGTSRPDNALRKKDGSDGLRVHELRGVIGL